MPTFVAKNSFFLIKGSKRINAVRAHSLQYFSFSKSLVSIINIFLFVLLPAQEVCSPSPHFPASSSCVTAAATTSILPHATAAAAAAHPLPAASSAAARRRPRQHGLPAREHPQLRRPAHRPGGLAPEWPHAAEVRNIRISNISCTVAKCFPPKNADCQCRWYWSVLVRPYFRAEGNVVELQSLVLLGKNNCHYAIFAFKKAIQKINYLFHFPNPGPAPASRATPSSSPAARADLV